VCLVQRALKDERKE
jgi:hypothetical protein